MAEHPSRFRSWAEKPGTATLLLILQMLILTALFVYAILMTSHRNEQIAKEARQDLTQNQQLIELVCEELEAHRVANETDHTTLLRDHGHRADGLAPLIDSREACEEAFVKP